MPHHITNLIRMDRETINMEIAKVVSRRMIELDVSKNVLSKLAAIPYSSLDRKLRGVTDFTATEFHRIGIVLSCSPKVFLSCFDKNDDV